MKSGKTAGSPRPCAFFQRKVGAAMHRRPLFARKSGVGHPAMQATSSRGAASIGTGNHPPDSILCRVAPFTCCFPKEV